MAIKEIMTYFKKFTLLAMLIIMMLSVTACGDSDMSSQTLKEGLYPMYEKGSDYDKDKWGYIDETGEYAIEPQFRFADYFSDGLARVNDWDTGLNGYIDGSGEYAIEPYYWIANRFINGYAVIEQKYYTGDEPDYISGYLRSDGEVVIPPKYGLAYNFNANGLAVVQKGTYNHPQGYALINTSGEEVGTVSESDIAFETWDFSNGPLLYKDEDTGMYGYVNKDGEYVIEPNKKYRDVSYFWNGMTAVYEEYDDGEYGGFMYGYMNDKGEMCTDVKFFTFDQAWGFSNGVALVRTLPDDEGIVSYGYIDKEGKWIIKKEYDKELELGY